LVDLATMLIQDLRPRRLQEHERVDDPRRVGDLIARRAQRRWNGGRGTRASSTSDVVAAIRVSLSGANMFFTASCVSASASGLFPDGGGTAVEGSLGAGAGNNGGGAGPASRRPSLCLRRRDRRRRRRSRRSTGIRRGLRRYGDRAALLCLADGVE